MLLNALKTFLSGDFTISKRLLGALMIAAGVIGFVGVLAIDILDVGREGGIGPSQRLVLAGCVAVALIGLTLLPLKDAPA